MILYNRIFYCLFYVLVEIISCQNFHYNSDDWYVLTSPGSINAIAEDHYNIYFSTDNGIFKYDKSKEDFEYDYMFSIQSDFHEIHHMIYDNFRDYFWVIHSKGISFKSSISSIWKEMSISNLNIFSLHEIDDIGFSHEFIWIRSNDQLYPFDPFTAQIVNWLDAQEDIDFIQWGYSRFGVAGKNLDISSYLIDGDWIVGLNNITHKDGRSLQPTIFMEDSEGNHWIGTDEGLVLKGWHYSSRLELITIGLPFDHVTTSYFDLEGNWWFADSQFKRTGNLSLSQAMFQRNNKPFISQWKETENRWINYTPKESNIIKNTDINSILRVGSILYFGTMHGLLYLDLFNNDWNIINTTDGLNDDAVWDIIENDKSLYLATAKGINEVSIINHSLIPDKDKRFEFLLKYKIYDMVSDTEFCYLATEGGLFKFDWKEGSATTISRRVFRRININNNRIFGTDGSLWLIKDGLEESHIASNIHDFDICGIYAWSSQKNKVSLLDLNTNWEWEYGQSDGILGNKIYGIECDEDWVWFLTNRGVSFYNWGDYHHQEN